MKLENIQSVYFIGIGGIGMSALARYFHRRGLAVAGYDRTETALTRTLVREGIAIHYTEDVNQLPAEIDLVVYTPAVPREHVELQLLRAEGLPVKKRAEVLGIISRGMRTVAIAGTHGKTTTTSILAYLLRNGGVDCTAFLGGIARNFESNFVAGQGEWVIVEADEYDRSFLQLAPDLAVVLSIDADHLDIYGDWENMLATGFRAFAQKIKPGGEMLLRDGLEASFPDLKEPATFGVEAGQYRAEHLRVTDGYSTFDWVGPGERLAGLKFTLPGRHNVENATAAIAVARRLGVDEAGIRDGLKTFRGIRRRFEFVHRGEVVYIDDYAHHPSELRAAIAAARQFFPGRKLTGVFQPHLYSRTRDFADGFAGALDELDEILLMDIYPAREAPIPGVSADLIFEKMKNPRRERTGKEELLEKLSRKELDVLLTLGAGDIDTFVAPIKERLEAWTGKNS